MLSPVKADGVDLRACAEVLALLWDALPGEDTYKVVKLMAMCASRSSSVRR